MALTTSPTMHRITAGHEPVSARQVSRHEHSLLRISLEGSRMAPHLCNSGVLLVVHAQEFCQGQEQLCTNRSVSVNTSHKADLWLFRLRLVGLVGDFEGPDLTELNTLTQTAKR